MTKFGVLLVGANGANGQALTLIRNRYRSGEISRCGGISGGPEFDQSLLPSMAHAVISGWDVRGPHSNALTDGACALMPMSGMELRIGDESPGESSARTVGDLSERVASDIASFKQRYLLETVLVINLSTPAPRCPLPLRDIDVEDCRMMAMDELPTSVAYLIGAGISGAMYIDFTPSETLELRDVETWAAGRGAQVAGRDGTTGQTWLKLIVATALQIRGISIDHWYSANVLGNRDGLALSHPEISETKISDKLDGLNQLAGTTGESHAVSITHCSSLADIKEAWDLIDFTDMFGNSGSLRMNWRAFDSPLAVQVLVDIIRLSVHGMSTCAPGIRRDLSIFFKKPIGVSVVSPIRQYALLAEAHPSLISSDARELW